MITNVKNKSWSSKLRYFKNIAFQTSPNKDHEKSWQEYESTALYYRSNVYEICKLFQYIIILPLGLDRASLSQKYLENEEDDYDFDKDIAQRLL